jgi:hypothetical protein
MSISSLGSALGSTLFSKLEAISNNDVVSTSKSAGATGGSTVADSSGLSGIGKLLSRLQDLATSDPAAFKKETADIAAKLGAAAKSTTGSESDFFTQLASQFQNASETGDASALSPAGRGHGHHHTGAHTNGADAASRYSSSTNLFSMLDGASTQSGGSLTSSQQDAIGALLGRNA